MHRGISFIVGAEPAQISWRYDDGSISHRFTLLAIDAPYDRFHADYI